MCKKLKSFDKQPFLLSSKKDVRIDHLISCWLVYFVYNLKLAAGYRPQPWNHSDLFADFTIVIKIINWNIHISVEKVNSYRHDKSHLDKYDYLISLTLFCLLF